jgi:hypothetical protein
MQLVPVAPVRQAMALYGVHAGIEQQNFKSGPGRGVSGLIRCNRFPQILKHDIISFYYNIMIDRLSKYPAVAR